MEYVFGSTLICEDAESAKRVTFDPAVRLKSVTLVGDVYDPSGTLSGGSAPQTSGVLVVLQQLHELDSEIEVQQTALDKLKSIMGKEQQKIEAARGMTQELELKHHEIALAEEQISNNSASTIINAVTEMKEAKEKLKSVMIEAKAKHDAASKDAQKIEKDMQDFAKNKDSKLVELQAEIADLKKGLAKQSTTVKPLQQSLREAMLEADQCGSDLAAAQERLHDAEVTLQTQQEEVDKLLEEQKTTKVGLHTLEGCQNRVGP